MSKLERRSERALRRWPNRADLPALASTCDAFAAAYPSDFVRFLGSLGPTATTGGRRPAQAIPQAIAVRLRQVAPVRNWTLDEIRTSEPVKWLWSTQWWARYKQEGEAAALRGLAMLFQLDCAFFLRHQWITELIAQWKYQGDADKIHAVFTGTPRRGRRDYKSALQQRERDLLLCAEVQSLLDQGVRYNQAMRRVSQRTHALTRVALSPSAIRRVYEKRKSGDYDPLVDLLWPRARKSPI